MRGMHIELGPRPWGLLYLSQPSYAASRSIRAGFGSQCRDLRRRIRTGDTVRRVVCLWIHPPGPGICGLKHQKRNLIGDLRSLEGVVEEISILVRI